MLQKVLAAVAVIGLLFVRGGLCQCFTNTDCSGDVVSAAGQRDCCVRTENGLSFNTGSNCKICIVHGFNRSHYYVLEEERLDTVFQLNVKGTSPLIDDLIITGIITTAADGTASNSDFQSLAPIPVTNMVDIRLFTANDEITLEYDDRVLLTFTPDNSALIPGIEGLGEYIRDTATVHIIDNDQLQINFGESDYRIVEGSGMLITITLQFRQNQNPFTVILTPVTVDDADSLGLGFFINSDTIDSSSRATAGDDFSQNGTIVTVPENRQEFQIQQFFTIVDDDIDEDEQSFVIVAEIGDDVPDKFATRAETGFNTSESISCFQLGVGGTECFGRRGATEIRIDDNDPMIIGFTERIRYVSEGQEGAVDLFRLEIKVNSVRTAERRHPMEFRLLGGSTNATVETLAPSSENYDATFGRRDNLNDPIETDIDLLPGQRSAVLLTDIRNDLISEDLECYSIGIFSVDEPGHREVFTCYEDIDMADNYFCEHTICIEDNDEPFEVKFVETTYTVSETMGEVNVCVNLTKPETDIFEETVEVSVVDYPSSVHIPVGAQLANPDPPDFLSRYLMVEGSDYAQQTIAVNAIDGILISELMRVICYNQTIYDDPCVELDEYVGLSLRVPEGTISPPPCDQASILILDNDRAIVGLEKTFFRVNESVGTVELCAVVFSPDISCPIKFPFEVRLFTEDGTAVNTMDYDGIDTLLMFDTCDKRRCTSVEITDDVLDELDEFFTYHLRGTSDLHPRIDLKPVDGQIEIVDNDVPITVGYDPTMYITSEGQRMVELLIVIFDPPAGGTPQPFTLLVSTMDGTAVANDDYNAVSNQLIQFNIGDTMQIHTIIINDDDECEKDQNENFFSNIALDSGVPEITVTVPRAMVTIDDTAEPECEPITVGYDPDSYVTTETAGSVTLIIRVFSHLAGAPRPFTLVVNTEDGTATVADGDYVPVAGEIVQFNTGDVTKNHTIIINDDDECEKNPNENFISNIALNSGIPDITVTVPRAMVTIDDTAEPECEPITVGYDPDSYVTTETGGSVTLNIRVFSHPAGAPRPFTLVVNTEDGTATVADGDYGPVSGQIIQFNAGDVTQPHTITINNDDVCEIEPANPENFFSNIALDSGIPDITVTVPRAMVTIDDTAEPDCNRNTIFVNDTLTGDPLLTVPIFTDPDVEPGDDIESLCYDVHGEDGAYFNLISDGCTSVNGYYQEAVTRNENIDLNVVTQIGVRARGNSACWNIQVDLDMCNTTVNGMPLASTTNDGISVKHYATSSRVRIAVPNCDDDTRLVMWVFCRSGRVEDHVTREYFSIKFIRFVVMRGLNLDEQSHGLIGQFWNVPVTISSYTGLFGGEARTDDYIITVDHPQSDPRSFVGLKSDVTWEFEKRVCYYVGNAQAGKLAEVADPNDSVIEGDYNDYKVDSLFATDFKYSHFNETQC